MVKNIHKPKDIKKNKKKNINIQLNNENTETSLEPKKPRILEELMCDYIIEEFLKKNVAIGGNRSDDTMMKLLYLSSRSSNIVKCKNKDCNKEVEYLKKCSKCGLIANELF